MHSCGVMMIRVQSETCIFTTLLTIETFHTIDTT